jgi:adenylosuccinate lyase
VQQVMRRYGVPDAYDKLKAISRGQRLDRAQLAAFIKALPIPADARKRLLDLTPARYTGLAAELASRV